MTTLRVLLANPTTVFNLALGADSLVVASHLTSRAIALHQAGLGVGIVAGGMGYHENKLSDLMRENTAVFMVYISMHAMSLMTELWR